MIRMEGWDKGGEHFITATATDAAAADDDDNDESMTIFPSSLTSPLILQIKKCIYSSNPDKTQ